MIILNPKEPKGAPVSGFMFEGQIVESHPTGEMLYYDDDLGEALLENFGFLKKLSLAEAEEQKKRAKENAFKCEYCEFGTNTKIALAGHMRKHKNEIDQRKEEESSYPRAKTKKVAKKLIEETDPTRDGLDGDGVEWYGGGAKETPPSMKVVPKSGQGHFEGGQI